MPKPSPVAVVEDPQHDKDIALWRELFSAVDYCKLKASSVYYGFGVPRGEGDPVVLVPGFLGNDLYLTEMYFWLRRLGYNAYMSRIGHNAQCPDKLMHRLLRTVNRAYSETGRPVHLIGHSFGGVLSRGVATRKPERIASVTTLGSPIKGVRVSPWVHWSILKVRRRTHKRPLKGKECYTDNCACGFLCTMNSSFSSRIPMTSLYTKTDGVVAWELCLDDDDTNNVEVSGSHVGLVWNSEVYKVVARQLESARDQLKDLRAEKTARIQARTRKQNSATVSPVKKGRTEKNAPSRAARPSKRRQAGVTPRETPGVA